MLVLHLRQGFNRLFVADHVQKSLEYVITVEKSVVHRRVERPRINLVVEDVSIVVQIPLFAIHFVSEHGYNDVVERIAWNFRQVQYHV